VVIVGSECPDVVEACKMTPAATMDEALALAAGELGDEADKQHPADKQHEADKQHPLDVLIVPHAMLTLPVVGG